MPAYRCVQDDGDDEDEDEEKGLPQQVTDVTTGERYKALAPGHIRSGPGLDTDKVGQLDVGEEIVVLSRDTVDEAVRVQFERGWVSLHAKSGKAILEHVADDDDAED